MEETNLVIIDDVALPFFVVAFIESIVLDEFSHIDVLEWDWRRLD